MSVLVSLLKMVAIAIAFQIGAHVLGLNFIACAVIAAVLVFVLAMLRLI